MKLTIEIAAPPEGYEYTGEYRTPREEEYFLTSDYIVVYQTKNKPFQSHYFILRPKKKKVIKFIEDPQGQYYESGNSLIYDPDYNTKTYARLKKVITEE